MYHIIILLLFTLLSATADAQNHTGDVIIGEWLSEEKDSRIEIYKVGSEYFGKLLWSEGLFESDGVTAKKDVQNTNEKLRTRSLHNVNILHGFVFEDGIWENGKMYDPKSGKTYNCLLKIRKNLLEVRSYIGIPLLGRSTYWERSLKDVPPQQ